MKRLALGEHFPLEKITRRAVWRGFQLTKEAIVTPDGISVRPASLRQLVAINQMLKLQAEELSKLQLRLWKLDTACRLRGIEYRDAERGRFFVEAPF